MSSLKIKMCQPNYYTQQFALIGSLDINTSNQFSLAIENNITSKIDVVILDLTDLEYISSAGLRVIFQLRKITKSNNGKMCVVNPQAQIQKVFNIVKVMPLDSIFGSIEELDKYLLSIQKKIIHDQKTDN